MVECVTSVFFDNFSLRPHGQNLIGYELVKGEKSDVETDLESTTGCIE